ncbi:MAG: uridine kinase [Gemmatimonadetes bacterium]|nr:uridine kinase [Gemmatimonadota bacterium]
MNRLVIGIAGGTGSGKTTVATNIMQRLDLDSVTILEQDAYYYDLTDLAPAQRERCNFDHPDSIEVRLFVEHIRALKAGQEIERPVYDFTVHARTTDTVPTIPRDVVIVEGILLFHFPEARAQLDIKIFVDTPSDIRLLRRITRDIHERGRTLESVTQQYLETVRPMHEEFVEPSKRHADVIIPEGGYNDIAIDMIASRIRLLRGVAM